MSRLFWVGVGAVGAVVVARRLREQVRRYTPDAVAGRVEAAGEQAGAAVTDALRRFREARTERERDLVATLLVTPDGGDPHAVFRRRDRTAPGAGDDPWGEATSARTGRPTGRVDPDEPLYDF